jgi:hypothetical protein
MTLIIEGGTGNPDAESYVSVANCAEYATNHGLTFGVSPESEAEAALRRATTWIDGRYGARFRGARTKGRDQALAWPRDNATDVEGNEIADDAVPIEVIRATCEAAVRELATPGGLSPDVTAGKIITAASVDGAVSVEYAKGSGIDGQRPIATVVDDILYPLIGKRSNTSVAMLDRA